MTRSKVKVNYLKTKIIDQYLQYLEEKVFSSQDDEFTEFLSIMTTDAHNVKVTPSKQVSTSSSSSGSSIVRMVQESPDSPESVISVSSSFGYSHVEGTTTCTPQEDTGFSVKVDQVQTSQDVISNRFTQETYSNIDRIQSVPGYTELINANVHVNMLQIHWLQYFTLYLKL